MGWALHALVSFSTWAVGSSDVLVTGATGRTGSLVYRLLKEKGTLGSTRALVRNVTEAREKLGCSRCDASEGVFVGDVTKPSSMVAAFEGVEALAIAVGVHGSEPEPIVKAIEFEGVKNQMAAFLAAGGTSNKRVTLISTMGTTSPPSGKGDSNNVFFWKLNAEAFLASAGVPFSVIKPCGLVDERGGDRELLVGHDDEEPWFKEGFFMIPRADVATITVAALTAPPAASMRFDLCAKLAGSGPPMSPQALLKQALLPWQKQGERVVDTVVV